MRGIFGRLYRAAAIEGAGHVRRTCDFSPGAFGADMAHRPVERRCMWAEGCDAVFDSVERVGSARRSHTISAAKGATAAAAARGDGVGPAAHCSPCHPTHFEPSFIVLNGIL